MCVVSLQQGAVYGVAGALPFFFVKSLSTLMTGLATAVACGVMFACSFDLVHSGARLLCMPCLAPLPC